MATSSAPADRLAHEVVDRRATLGLRQADLAEAAGLSVATIQDIEAGKGRPRPVTIGALERALEWQPGSVRAILNGGQPTPLTPKITATDASNERMAFVIAHRGELSEHTRRALEAMHDAALEELRNRHHHEDRTASR